MKKIIAKARKIAIVTSWTIIALFGALVIGTLTMPDSPEEIARQERVAAQEEAAKVKKDARLELVGTVVSVVKPSLRVPDSFKARQVLVMEDNTVCMSYNGQNGFGGTSVETIAVNKTGIVDYAKHCSGKRGIDETGFANTWAKWN